ncbi:AarF/ABC1/UbiB kinase family protein [Defluviicoccus vanus]|uniref:AarF/ABC1/UbiB kinase family protein n=1 Tax=Defluviicoccus vanus TaxID=111831 RepID=A0A7H1MXF6_9PROT|nr:AarF/ABC1/UbiB kinase family protein [Defluviicoccus vanus]
MAEAGGPTEEDAAALGNNAAADAAFSDEDRLASRLKRYARVGSTVGGLAVRFAGNQLFGMKIDRPEHALELKTALGGLKGPLMKVAQILATVPDMLPAEYTEELAQLQQNAPPMGWSFVKRRMAAELGPEWQNRFQSFEHTATAAASLGQVHRATAHDGRRLACKLQYPDMASAVEADLSQLKVIFSIYRRYDRAIDPSNIHAELTARLREELDYRREAKHMALYRWMLEREAQVHVPEPLLDLSSDRLLTMTWLDGESILSFVDQHAELRNAVAVNMFRAWYVPFYEFGVLHGDPHLGNYSVRADGSINLLDFGCIRVFPPSFIGAVIDLYWALRNDDRDLAVHAYETWGFSNLSREIIDILNQWASFLYRPLMEDRVQTIQRDNSVAYGAKVAGRVQQQLREAGGVAPPREFVLMDRAAIGLGSVFTRLRAEINWHRLFHELIEGHDPRSIAERQQAALNAVALPPPA